MRGMRGVLTESEAVIVMLLHCRQQGGCVHLRRHRGRGRPRGDCGLQPRQPERLRLRQGEAGFLQQGGGLEVGRLLGGRPLRPGLLQDVRGRSGNKAERQDPHEFTQQRSGAKGQLKLLSNVDQLTEPPIFSSSCYLGTCICIKHYRFYFVVLLYNYYTHALHLSIL